MRLAIAEDSGLFRSSLTLLLEASGAEVTGVRVVAADDEEGWGAGFEVRATA